MSVHKREREKERMRERERETETKVKVLERSKFSGGESSSIRRPRSTRAKLNFAPCGTG